MEEVIPLQTPLFPHHFSAAERSRTDSPNHPGVPYLWCHTSIIASELTAVFLPHGQNMMWAKRVGATSCTCAGASPGWGSYSYFKAWLATNHKVESANCAKIKIANNSNEVCSPKVRLQAAGLISRCIYLLWPSPHITAPSLWPCVGWSGGQSTTIALHLGGCWWRRGWEGGATMVTRQVRLSTTPWETFLSSWPLSAPATASTQHWTGCHEKRERLSMQPAWAEPPRQKTQCEGRDNVEQPLLTVPELRAAAALSSNVQPVTLLCEWIGRTSPPRSAGSPMQPQQEETNANIADVSPLHAGRNPLYIKKKGTSRSEDGANNSHKKR